MNNLRKLSHDTVVFTLPLGIVIKAYKSFIVSISANVSRHSSSESINPKKRKKGSQVEEY